MHNRCFTCDNIDTKKKKPGQSGGNLYYCKKNKAYVNPCTDGCDKWEKCWSRNSSQNDELYYDGKKYDDRSSNLKGALFALVVVIIIGIISLIASLFK